MTADDAADLLLQTIRGNTRNVAARPLNYVRKGAAEMVENPFTGQPVELPVPEGTKIVADKLRSAGLHQDPAFMQNFEKLLRACAENPMFSLLSAFDGEGAFEGDVQLKITTADGKPLPTHLHEIFYRGAE